MVPAKLIFGVVGNVVSVLMLLSPAHTVRIIVKNKSTQLFSGLPYVFILLNCLLWVLYGTPLVTEGAILVLTINGAGAVFQIVFITLFLIYADKENRKKVSLLLSAVVVAVVTSASVTLLAIKDQAKRQREVGSICVVLNIVMYISPLSVIKMVILTKSVAFMPFFLSFFIFLNSAVWTGYGVASKDVFLVIPNGVGTLFGAVQLALHIIYRGNKPPLLDLESGSPSISDSKPSAKTDAMKGSPKRVADGTDCAAKPAGLEQGE